MKPRVITKCVANAYSGENERIIEFNSDRGGGLIAFREIGEELIVSAYVLDPTVNVLSMGPDDLLTLAEIAEATGATLLTVRTWTHRYSDFPEPWKDAAGTYLYLRREVLAWLKATGREVPAKWHNL